MGLALYRKYRSRTLDDIVGQDHVTTLLRRAIKSGKTAHAYLFTGPRGVGKTSIARILAHAINESDYGDETAQLDIIEIDAASNNGVDDIRGLREKVQLAPVVAKKKIYIIDEVHMLSKPAFNALLKTLEEPPEHVVFILATTDIDKVPETIISRTQRHTFKRASVPDIVRNLERIANAENVQADKRALDLIAQHSDGSFRDSVSLLDQLISGADGKLTVDDVTNSLGLASDDTIRALIDFTDSGDVQGINQSLLALESTGTPARTTSSQLVGYIRGNLTEHPKRIKLLNDLLDVSKSGYPDLKLLTTLASFAGEKPQKVSRQMEPSHQETAQLPASSDDDSNIEDAPVPEMVKPTAPPVSTMPHKPPRKTASTDGFNWSALLSHVKSNHVALHSVLSKCQPEIDGDTLRLFTSSAFYKKKLDTPKFKQLLNESLNELNQQYDVDVVASRKPLADSQAERIAAMMGGGEEVSYE